MTNILKVKVNGEWQGIAVTQGDTVPIQSDWEQDDNTKLDYIKNKPDKLSDLTDDTSTNPIDKADTLTGLSASVSELNYCDGVTSNIQTQLGGKASVDFTNVDSTGTCEGASWALPSSTYEQLTLGATGSKYTAPANGWFSFGKTFSASGNNYVYIVLLDENENYVMSSMSRESTAGQVSAYMPVVKGDKIAVEYAAGNGNAGLRFVYAKGSESEAQ